MFARPNADKAVKVDAAYRAAKRAERQAKRFARLDGDGDGSISKAEWDQHGADRAAKRAERGEKRAAAGEAGQGKRHAMRRHNGQRGGQPGIKMIGKAATDGGQADRAEGRRAGTEGVMTCRSRWAAYH